MVGLVLGRTQGDRRSNIYDQTGVDRTNRYLNRRTNGGNKQQAWLTMDKLERRQEDQACRM